jgi:hypothetical protein
MSVSTSDPALGDSGTGTPCVFLDNNASLKKAKRKRTRYVTALQLRLP